MAGSAAPPAPPGADTTARPAIAQPDHGRVALALEGVSKRFRRSGIPRSLKETVVRPRSWFSPSEEFWALKDVFLEVYEGETLGVVGDNGSGKSTILKLFAGILRPTGGRVAVAGSIAPLLELGVGFHGDLTGRENIFLNGALLGFDRGEMTRRLEAIVDFAELWPFIDTPVRSYSSGMVVRLGFAIAVQVDPDILLVDEVLAVGDQAFQGKCHDAIADLKRRGKTIVFVTHALPVVQRMCTRAAWVSDGRIASLGTPDSVVGDYLAHIEQHESDAAERGGLQGAPAFAAGRRVGRRASIVGFETRADGELAVVLEAGAPARIAVGLRAGADGDGSLDVAVSVFAADGTRCFRLESGAGRVPALAPRQTATVLFDMEALPLAAGTYHATVELRDVDGLADLHDRAYAFRVHRRGPAWGIVTVPYQVQLGVDEPRAI